MLICYAYTQFVYIVHTLLPTTYYFINNFYVIYPIFTKFSEIILGFIIIVYFKMNCTSLKLRLEFAFYGFAGREGRGQI